ncbi:MAG: M48 family metalloprotease, partial [Desulfohalobiaceae bacterium]|nr:M48 family metalloprotease [Desulfohalobiaceae bacterium]
MKKANSICSTLLWLLLLSLFLAGCTTVKATGERHLTLMGESQEIARGKQVNEQIQRSMKLYPDKELQTYVDHLGKEIAATTERPDLPWEFHILDDEAVNAFALPGGFIYVTRGIMAYFENEAQLVGVLGHEIAHVTGKHTVIRMSKSVLAQVGFGMAQILAPELKGLAPAARAGLQLLFLKFSREDETEADILGVRYMRNVNVDPRELIDVMEMLARVSQDEEKGSIPQWASTHPLPENRRETITSHLKTVSRRLYEPVERSSYLRRLDGMTYGKDPRDGIVRGNHFYHPDLRFKYAFPPTWKVVNQKQAAIGISPNKDAVIQMTLAKQRSAEEALRDMFRKQG